MTKPPQRMQAALLRRFDGPLELGQLRRPTAAAGQALVRVRAVGLCGTDLKILAGVMRPDLALPAVLGHEIAGEVVESTDPSLCAGTRVACYPYLTCGLCRPCDRGQQNICSRARLFGLDEPGGLAEYLAAPVANLLPLSAGTEFAAAAVSMDAVAVTWHALVGRGQLTRDERVVVVGAGGLGLNAVQIALGRGAEVAVVEPDAGRRAVAERLGVKCAVAPDEQAELAGWADLSLEVSGTRAGFDAAVSTLGEGGRLICCGYYPGTEFGLDSRELVGREVSVLGSRGSTRSDAAAALAAVERGEIRPVIDSVWELARADEAVARLCSGRALGRVVIAV